MRGFNLLAGLARKKEVASATLAYNLGAFRRRLSRRVGDYILEFHGVDKIGSDLFNWRFISERNLKRLVTFLIKNGSIVSLESMINTKGNGLRFALTFDDGYQSVKSFATELSQNGIPITIFVTPNEEGDKILWADQVDIAQRLTILDQLEADGRRIRINNSRYELDDGTLLSHFLKESSTSFIKEVQEKLALRSTILSRYKTYWKLLDKDDIRELSTFSSITFGSHGISHTSMDVMSDLDLEIELASSKRWIETNSDRPVHYLAFPCGRYNSRTIEVGRNLGYQHFFTESKMDIEEIHLPFVSRRIGLYNRCYFSLLIKDLIESQ